MKRLVLVNDVTLPGKITRAIPRGFRSSGKQPGQPLTLDDHAESELGNVDHGTRAIDHPAHGCPFVADDFWRGDHRAQPVKEIQNLRARNSRKQIFVAARKSDHFVGKHRSDDDDLVVVKHHSIHVHRHVHRE